jgi:hypothetical protein
MTFRNNVLSPPSRLKTRLHRIISKKTELFIVTSNTPQLLRNQQEIPFGRRFFFPLSIVWLKNTCDILGPGTAQKCHICLLSRQWATSKESVPVILLNQCQKNVYEKKNSSNNKLFKALRESKMCAFSYLKCCIEQAVSHARLLSILSFLVVQCGCEIHQPKTDGYM